MADVTQAKTEEQTPFEKFKDFTSRMLQVSKEELQEEMDKDKDPRVNGKNGECSE